MSMEVNLLLEMLDAGQEAWNNWRDANPTISINLSGQDLSNRDLSGYDFSEINLSYCNFSKSDLSGANLISARLEHAKLNYTNLEHANLIASEMAHADLTLAKVKGAKFLTAQLAHTNFSHVDFSGHSLQGMDFRKTKLNGAILRNQNLKGMNFSESDLSQADLTEATLEDANLQGANLTRAVLNDTSFQDAFLKEATLDDTDLSGKDLSGINFVAAKLNNCDLRNTILERAVFDNAILTGSKFFNVQNKGWSIRNVRCEVAYWDKQGVVASRYRKQEFEKLYAESIVIELRYDKYIASHELSSLPIFVEHLEALHWGIKLRVKSIREVAGGTIVNIVVQDTGGMNSKQLEQDLKEEASHLLAAQIAMRNDRHLLTDFKESIAQVKNQFWPRLLELASDSETGKMRMFTVMLLDLKGFSRWKGDELDEKLALFRGLVKPILKRWKASYPNMEGDSLRATFQNASVGVACASMIKSVLDAAGFPCRIGMDLGEVVLQFNEVTEQTDLSGEAVNFAARLEALGQGGELLISERVWHYVKQQEDFFLFEPRFLRLEKGVGNLQAGEQIHCYRVTTKKALI
ncbi:MAG: pentapeptide repeat-containing protein [Gammaproteobacteria bacterium]|nr:pentapeptide repeat-containing protein [Gammaproteobacteria bacterium]